MLGATDCLAHVARQAVGGDDAEPDAGDDADAGLLGPLVEVVEGEEHLQLVADVEVVHSRVEASFGEWGRSMQERAGGIEDQVHVGQSRLQCGRIVQAQRPGAASRGVRRERRRLARFDRRARAGDRDRVHAVRSGCPCTRWRRRASRLRVTALHSRTDVFLTALLSGLLRVVFRRLRVGLCPRSGVGELAGSDLHQQIPKLLGLLEMGRVGRVLEPHQLLARCLQGVAIPLCRFAGATWSGGLAP